LNESGLGSFRSAIFGIKVLNL